MQRALVTAASLFMVIFASATSANDRIDLQIYEVMDGVKLPFPHVPESLGEMRSEAFLERGWRADKNNVGFTALVHHLFCNFGEPGKK